jgi:putative ABC transport system permease protein
MIPVRYNARNLIVRWKTTLMTAAGFTLVVSALVIMLAFIAGIQAVCTVSGDPQNVLVLAKGANDEVFSTIDTRAASEIENARGIVRDRKGRPMVSRELFLVVHRLMEDENVFKFLQIRGVQPTAYEVHDQVRILAGRMARQNQSEIIIGRGVQSEHRLNLGDTVEIGRKPWKVSGIFEANRSALESEVWCDLSELQSQFRREGFFSTLVIRAGGVDAAAKLAQQLSSSRTAPCTAQPEQAYYAKQAENTQVMRTGAIVIAWFMGVGAIFGVMNTMFAAIGQRRKDIAVLRIIGYRPYEIVVSFLLEALLIAAIGGCLGISLGYAANGFTTSASVSAHEVQLAFRVDQTTVLIASLVTFLMGLFGGLLPALSVVRVQPLEALR